MNNMLNSNSLCPVCNGRFERMDRDWLYRCKNCKLLASSLEPVIPNQRSRTVLDETQRLEGLYEARRRSNKIILDKLGILLGHTDAKILDVGCGHGLFLGDAIAAGFKAEGVEPDANVVDQSREATGAPVRHGYFPDVLNESDRFDAIVFNDVLEHIPEAANAISASFQHLSKGGILVLNCPDKDGVFYRLASALDRIGKSGPLLRMWQYGLPSPHVWYFSVNHLSRLGQAQGFEPVGIEKIKAITAKGLRQRVSYVEGQSRLMNGITIAVASVLLPFLDFFPRDTSIAFLRKG